MCMIPCEKLGEDRGGLSQEKLVICLPTLLFHNLKLIYELKEKHEEREQLWGYACVFYIHILHIVNLQMMKE